MDDQLYIGQAKDVILGQDFLTWLWFKSEASRGLFTAATGEEFTLYVEQRISVQGGEGESKETATVSGALSELKEARLGLTTGKKVNRALIRIEQDADNFALTLKAEDFSLTSLKTPAIDTKTGDDEDPDGPFLEKLYLIERALFFLDDVYKKFLELRLSAKWAEEEAQARVWLAAE